MSTQNYAREQDHIRAMEKAHNARPTVSYKETTKEIERQAKAIAEVTKQMERELKDD